jgi:hypothetical protein
MTDDNREREARAAIFLKEHQAKAKIWHNEETGVIAPYGIPGPAGPGPTQSNDSPGADSGDGSKA